MPDKLDITETTKIPDAHEIDPAQMIIAEEISRNLPNIAENKTITTTKEILDELDYEVSIPELTPEQLWEK